MHFAHPVVFSSVVVAFSVSAVAEAQQPPRPAEPPATAQAPAVPPPAAEAPPGPPAAPPPSYGYGYGPPAGYGTRPPAPRSEMAYESGDPVPDGYELESRLNKGLVIAGATTFGAVYLLTAVAGAVAVDNSVNPSAYEPLFIPLAGPFVTIHTADATATGTLALVIDGLAQAAGLGMLIGGLASPREVLVWRGEVGGVTFEPDLGPGGAVVRGTF